MGFYKTKIEDYLGKIELTGEHLETAKENMINGMRNAYLKHIEDLRYSRMAQPYGAYDDEFVRIKQDEIYPLTSNTIFLINEELKFVLSLSTEDFYRYFSFVENYHLGEIINNRTIEFNEVSKKLDKYVNKKGLVGKTSSVLGTDKKKIERLGKSRDEIKAYIDFLSESKSEFQSLPEEEKVAYLIGRYEVDKQLRFDPKVFNERFKGANEKSNIIDENQNGNENSK